MKIHKYSIEISAEFYITATSEQEAADKAMKLVTRNHDLLSITSLRKTAFTVWNPPGIEIPVNGASEARQVSPQDNFDTHDHNGNPSDEVPF